MAVSFCVVVVTHDPDPGLAERLEAPRPETGSAEALLRIAEAQEKLLKRLEDRESDPHFDPESRMRLRSIDTQMLRLIEEVSAGRQESIAELRADFAALTRALRQSNRQEAGRAGAEAGRRRD